MSGKIYCIEKDAAFKNRIRTYALVNDGFEDLSEFLRKASKIFKKKTQKILRKLHVIKVNTCLEVQFIRKVSSQENKTSISSESESESDNASDSQQSESNAVQTEEMTYYFQTKNETINASTSLRKWFKRNISEPLNEKVSEFVCHGSGWSIKEVIELCVNNNKYVCFSGSSYLPLPSDISNKKAIINVRNDDEKCFVWSILAALHNKDVKKNPQVASKYKKYLNKLNLKDLTYPVTLNQIKTFEKNNPWISVNVYMYELVKNEAKRKKEHVIVPVRLTKEVKTNHIHLLLLFDDSAQPTANKNISELLNSTNQSKTHYCWVKDLSKLINTNVSRSKRKLHVCDRCLHFFYTNDKLKNHIVHCKEMNECKITLPTEEEKFVRFKNFDRQLECPFIIYADMEALLAPVNDSLENCPKGAYQKHIAHSIGYYFSSRSDSLKSYYRSYTDLDCADWFSKELTKIASKVWKVLLDVKPMTPLTREQKRAHKSAQKCHICKKDFTEEEPKIYDHSHISGAYRGAAHTSCNLNYKESRHVPVVFHNLQYDLHFLIEKLAEDSSENIEIIPMNKEKYIAFSKKYNKSELSENGDDGYFDKKANLKFRFIDSFRFMAEPLQKLASYLTKSEFSISKSVWNDLSEEQFELITKKGVYPYDYMNSMKKLKKTKLPSIEKFYNQLTDSNITEQEYQFAQNVWKEFNVKNMQQYTNIYLKADVLILADIFENFRSQCLQIYGLDPAHYVTTPSYSWDAMLKQTRVQLELITDIDQQLFIERGNNIFFSCDLLIFVQLYFVH